MATVRVDSDDRKVFRMHVGLILPSYNGAGAMQIPSISLLASGLARQIDVTVIPLRNPDGISATHDESVSLLDPGAASLRFRSLLRATIDAIRSRHRVHSFDLLHGYWLFEPGFVAAVAGKLLRIPVVASIGGAELVALPEIGYGGMRAMRGRMLNRATLAAATVVTGGSSYVVGLARRVSPASGARFRVVPLPVETNLAGIEPDNPYSRTGIQLLQAAAYLPVKGQDISVRALATVLRDRAPLQLTMIGEDPHGYRRRMRDLAGNLGIADRVQFLERMPHAALAGYYRHSDLLLMPSRHESQGMVVLEAAAHGLPTVGSNVGVVGDLAPEAAVAVPPGDVEGLAAEIGRLVQDQARRDQLGRTARETVQRRYGIEPVVRQWITTYEEAIGGA